MNSMNPVLNTAALQQMDRDSYLHPFTDSKALHEKGTRVVTGAKGVYIFDSDGNRILDAMAGLWCVNIGYGHDELADVAAQQMKQLAYYNSFFGTANVPAIELAAKVKSLAPANIDYIFFTGSGSEANDTNLRMVRHYWALKGQPEKRTVISRENAYHGSTLAGMSLGGMEAMHKQGGVIDGIAHIMQPHWYKESQPGESEVDFGLRAAKALEDKILELGADKVGAFIGEPIQGAGGVIVPPASYWPEIQRICKKYDLLLILDEVITGFGRTGNWFAAQTYNIEADMIPFAKGLSSGYLPIGGVAISKRVAEVMIDGGEFAHGYTYSGHPVSAAVAKANIEIMQREGLIDQVCEETGPYLQAKLSELSSHPLVGQVRGTGMLGALELVKDKATREPFDKDIEVAGKVRDSAIVNGLMVRAVGDCLIMSPPLCITKAEIDELIGLLTEAMDRVQTEVL